MTNEIYTEDKMKQLPVYPTKQTPSYADWNLFNMGKALEEKVDNIDPTGGYTAGTGIAISEEKVISNTAPGINYTAGTGISISEGVITNDAPNVPQVQADWNEVDSEAVDYIKNKPTIPAAQVQSDWNQSDNTAVDFIKNKPTIPDVTTKANTSLDNINVGSSNAGKYFKVSNTGALELVTITEEQWTFTLADTTTTTRTVLIKS